MGMRDEGGSNNRSMHYLSLSGLEDTVFEIIHIVN